MIIRATKKLLNISGIKPIKNFNVPNKVMPGEWYASTISLQQPGKLAVHFLHYPSFISILIPGKSLNKVLSQLKPRTIALLNRLGYSDLIPYFNLDSNPEIFATNSRSILAHINQVKYNMEYHIADSESVDSIDYNRLEDIHFDSLFTDKSSPRGYITPKNILDNLLSKNKSVN
jgi:hypothetical protein